MGATLVSWALILAGAWQSQSGCGLGSLGVYAQSSSGLSPNYTLTCEKIAVSISSASQVFYPGSQDFNSDISHWANSSSQVPACSVEPGTPSDVGLILQDIADAHVPFAIKGGGHTANPGFSSTPGVHISMARFNDIVVDEQSGTVDIGAGLTWTDVYAYLTPKNLGVVGGRLNGVGVAGLTLGGGYSWKTNQYGLTIDSVTAFELVLPNGDVAVVTEKDEDLWFALKGGFNNYGIVTKFTLKMHPQTSVWGALLAFAGDLIDPAQAAFAKFLAKPHDHKGAQLGTFAYSNLSISFEISLFYNGPEPPAGLYDELLSLSTSSKSIVQGTFTDFVSSQFDTTNKRGYFNGIPMLNYTEPIINAFANETKFWGDRLIQYDDSVLVVYTLEPMESDYLTHGGPSAFPPNRSLAVLQSNMYLGYTSELADPFMADAMRSSAATMMEVGIQDGQDLKNAAPYVNYALFGTPLTTMYGEHLERLHQIREKYDPEDVMGLAGGWKF
ncbi:FAD-binding domain-containing protein [Russula compacta]|nr:FAD-binding domain-containing protein [Russula compacta]